MALSTIHQLTILLMFFLVSGQHILLPFAELSSISSCYDAIYSFGDSLIDTGNLLYANPNASIGRLPYGQTFFHHPTGRSSDGRLVIDFLAEALGMPYIPPYLPHSTERSFEWGANFAVGGATALDPDFFAEKGIPMETPYCLTVQLAWFLHLLPSICSSPAECRDRSRRTLFIVGEIGGNDYSYAFIHGWSIPQVKVFVPRVIAVTQSTIERLIEVGATSILVQGMATFGCMPKYLTEWPGRSRDDYDEHSGCLDEFNEFGRFHDRQLLAMLDRLRRLHPRVSVVFADNFNSAMRIFNSPRQFGITEPLRACCGGGGPYNYNDSRQCGDPAVQSCDDPQSYGSWDGIQGTEALHRAIAQGWLHASLSVTPFSHGEQTVLVKNIHTDMNTIEISGHEVDIPMPCSCLPLPPLIRSLNAK